MENNKLSLIEYVYDDITSKQISFIKIYYDVKEHQLVFSGEMRYSRSAEYKNVKDKLLEDFVSVLKEDTIIKLNFEDLQYLNSLGQRIVGLFIMELRRSIKIEVELFIFGSKKYDWHTKYLYTLKQLWKHNIKIFFDGEESVEERKKICNISDWKNS